MRPCHGSRRRPGRFCKRFSFHSRRILALSPEGSIDVFAQEERSSHHVPAPGEPTVPELEEDETIAPRPEEEIADVLRAEPDVEDHRQSRA